MGKVILETIDDIELKIKTSLTSKQIEKFVKNIEKKEKARKLINSTFNTIKENENIEKHLEELWYEQ